MIGVACQVQPQTYRPLTEPELQVYLTAHALTPVAVEQWKDITLILFDNGQAIGVANVAMDGNGNPVGNILTASGTGEKQPGTDLSPTPPPGRIATVWTLGPPLDNTVMAILIYDEKLAAGTSTVMIVFQNGQQASSPTHGHRGVFVHDPAAATGWQTVRFYTAAGEVVGELTQ